MPPFLPAGEPLPPWDFVVCVFAGRNEVFGTIARNCSLPFRAAFFLCGFCFITWPS